MRIFIAFILGALCVAYPVVGLSITGGLLVLGAAALLLIGAIYDHSVPADQVRDWSDPD